jgi:hypothetical protein
MKIPGEASVQSNIIKPATRRDGEPHRCAEGCNGSENRELSSSPATVRRECLKAFPMQRSSILAWSHSVGVLCSCGPSRCSVGACRPKRGHGRLARHLRTGARCVRCFQPPSFRVCAQWVGEELPSMGVADCAYAEDARNSAALVTKLKRFVISFSFSFELNTALLRSC